MKRYKELENAVGKYLDIQRIPSFRVDNYRCYKCGAIQNSRAKGFPDFLVLSQKPFALECKTGKARLTKEQKYFKSVFEAIGIEYMVLRDTVDKLIERAPQRPPVL